MRALIRLRLIWAFAVRTWPEDTLAWWGSGGSQSCQYLGPVFIFQIFNPARQLCHIEAIYTRYIYPKHMLKHYQVRASMNIATMVWEIYFDGIMGIQKMCIQNLSKKMEYSITTVFRSSFIGTRCTPCTTVKIYYSRGSIHKFPMWPRYARCRYSRCVYVTDPNLEKCQLRTMKTTLCLQFKWIFHVYYTCKWHIDNFIIVCCSLDVVAYMSSCLIG